MAKQFTVKITPDNPYNQILAELYKRYHSDSTNSFSPVTSSHWIDQIKRGVTVRHDGNKYHVSGRGFGNFKKASILNHLAYLPYSINTWRIYEKHIRNRDIFTAGLHVAHKTGRLLDYDCTRLILSADYILHHTKDRIDDLDVICVIGDGYGYTTSLFATLFPNASIICVNLGKILFFDALYIQKVIPEPPLLITRHTSSDEIHQNRICYLDAENYDLIANIPIQLFVNVASFQEMTNDVINQYFEYMRKSPAPEKFLYCCNRIEKRLPGGEIIRYDEYPWNDVKVIHSELCPWMDRYPSRKYPFWRNFDGPTHHTLARMR